MKKLNVLIQLLVFVAVISSRAFSGTASQAIEDHPIAAESGYLAVDGGRIFYEVAGQGPAIVMVHDGILHRETWDAQFTELAGRYRVVRWDRRGYGRSDAPKTAFSHLDDMLALIKTLKLERVTLMGCSAGGLLTIYFALEHPELVRALVLVGPIVSGMSFSDHFVARGNRGIPDAKAPVEQKIAYWTSKDPWILAPQNVTAKQKMKDLLKANPQNLQSSDQLARWPNYAALGRLSEIKVPTLIVAGESDIPDVHAHIGAIEAGISGSKRVVLTDSGHLPHLEVPQKFNEVALKFLGDIR